MATPAPVPPPALRVPVRGLAKVEHFRELLRDLAQRIMDAGLSSEPSRTLRYFQPDKTSGLAKTQELRRVHTLLLRGIPSGNRTPFKARKLTGVLKCSDLHAFRKHWLAILKAETQTIPASS